MAGDAHIGPEHAHAQTAMDGRARELAARGGLPEAAAPAPPVPLESGPQAPAPPALADPVREGPVREDPVREESDEDFGFIDGRWTSEGW